MKFSRRIGLVLCLALASGASIAGPARCSPGNQDSSCVGVISTAWQAPPTCPTDAGWTTLAAAQWIGSQYTAPQCKYQPAPGCPPGYVIQSGPTWNGSSWDLSCAPQAPHNPIVVSATGFWVWVDCGSYNGGVVTGPMPVSVYKDTWSDGSVTYYQGPGDKFPVAVDSHGRYYATVLGDNWDTNQGNGYPLPSLYYTGAGDPSVSIPPQPAYACSGAGGNH
jgi:hypothetical protein